MNAIELTLVVGMLTLCVIVLALNNEIEKQKRIKNLNEKNVIKACLAIYKKFNNKCKTLIYMCKDLDNKMEIMIGTKKNINANNCASTQCVFMEKHESDLQSYLNNTYMHFNIGSLKYLPMVKQVKLSMIYKNTLSVYYYNDDGEKIVLSHYLYDEDEDDKIISFVHSIRPDIDIV